MSMKPGATTWPPASSVRRPSSFSPISVMRSPVTSSTVPPRMTRSAVMDRPFFRCAQGVERDKSARDSCFGPYYALTFVSGKKAGAVPGAMRAAVYHGPRDVGIEQRPVPDLGPHDVLLEVSHCGVCGSDLHMFVDWWAAPNSIGGHEFSGRVVA